MKTIRRIINMPLTWFAVGVTFGLIILFISRCNGPEPEIGYIRDSTQYWRNAYGQVVASLKQREADFAVVQKGYLDSIANMHNTTARKIQEAITMTLRGQATIPAVAKPQVVYETKYRDTGSACPPQIKSVSNFFHTPYYDASATIYLDADSSYMDLLTHDTISVVTKIVKEGNIFHRRQYIQVDATNANPYNAIEGLKVFRLPAPKPKRFGIGPQFGVTIDASGKPSPYAGIGISFNLIRL